MRPATTDGPCPKHVIKALYAGSIYYSGELNTIARTVSGLPTNGATIYVMLWSKIKGVWIKNDYTYTAGSGGATLTGSSVNFTRTPGTGIATPHDKHDNLNRCRHPPARFRQ